jgi:hypothetical protein
MSGSNPRLRACATELARKFHNTRERRRVPRASRVGWDDLPGDDRELLIETLYSLLYRGIVVCTNPDHRIGIDLREERHSG